MGMVEDVPKLLLDLVTPEMRALTEQVKATNEMMAAQFKATDGRIDDLRVEMNRRFDYLERSFRLDERISAVEDKISKPPKRQGSH